MGVNNQFLSNSKPEYPIFKVIGNYIAVKSTIKIPIGLLRNIRKVATADFVYFQELL
ncbi:hypothetical protein SAMN05421797_10236 [Maribacter ulvicola]|uniref:Uncharacterized protein n=1 Tax=Maribacter ulvicola TaxID=228959 RepID=A0A1N6TPF8_9FLAO|nr:hypothetical protein SAMN05421797_10236 [Maribacter ulvicola]